MTNLLTLLQVNDSMFPIGSFTHSYGLESYVSNGLVNSNDTARQYATTVLQHSTFYNDAAFLNKAWHAAEANSWETLCQIDQLATAVKSPMEIRQASHKLAVRFLKLVIELDTQPWLKRYLEAIQEGHLHGHYAIAFGLYCQLLGIPREDALRAFYYNTLNGIMTNCAKTVPISQMVGQKIVHELKPLIEELVARQDTLPENLVGLCCIGQDIQCMQHEKLYTRIYIS